MPELPEVETIRLGVERHVRGRVLDDIHLLSARATRHDPDLDAFADLTGREIREVARRGKFLWFVLDGAERALVVHLGMSGQLLFRHEPHAEPARHLAAILELGGPRLEFVDQRTFGYVRTSPFVSTDDGAPGGTGTTRGVLPASLSHIGRDALDPHLDVAAAAGAMARTSSAIKRVLLDQRYVSGIGNIYADETLHAARVHPEEPANLLGEERLAGVVSAAAEVMRAAVAVGGTSFDALYVDADGEAGYFARELRAYGRAGAPCRGCGGPIVRSVVGGRSTFTCVACQPRRSSLPGGLD